MQGHYASPLSKTTSTAGSLPGAVIARLFSCKMYAPFDDESASLHGAGAATRNSKGHTPRSLNNACFLSTKNTCMRYFKYHKK